MDMKFIIGLCCFSIIPALKADEPCEKVENTLKICDKREVLREDIISRDTFDEDILELMNIRENLKNDIEKLRGAMYVEDDPERLAILYKKKINFEAALVFRETLIVFLLTRDEDYKKDLSGFMKTDDYATIIKEVFAKYNINL